MLATTRYTLALLLAPCLLVAACASPATPSAAPTAAKAAAQPAPAPTAAPKAVDPTKPAAAAPATKKADDWPTKPITIICPFDAGGSADRLARGLAPFLSKELGVPVTVENKPGAGGQLGHTAVLQAPDDGYTLLLSPVTPYMVNNILQTGAKFKMNDFAFANAQWIDYDSLFIGKDKPWKTFGELVSHIKANPKKVSTGVTFGSVAHLSTILLLQALKIPDGDVNIVTYDGGGPMRTAAIGGQIDFTITSGEGGLANKDMLRSLAVWLEQPTQDWSGALPINEALKPYSATVPLISGTVRALATAQTFRQKYPDRWETLLAAYKRTLDNKEYKDWLKTNNMRGEWYGPEKSTKMILDSYDILEKYKDLAKQ